MYNTHYLKNGICLVSENIPFAKSVSVGIWVRAGSMYETKKENGISHFIEHMLFKGTEKRTALKIAEEMDFYGGQMNAYTARECTCYYTKTPSAGLELSIDILSDMYYNSLFNREDIELERKVIIEEINMYEDSPEDVALDTLAEFIWRKNPLGYPVSGTVGTVKKITRNMMLDYMRRRYTPENTVISVAGCFDEKKLIKLCEKYFDRTGKETPVILEKPEFVSMRRNKIKDIEQSHLSIGFPAYELGDDRIYPLSVLNNILGDSMSSRLFQEIREKHGLCYSIYSYTAVLPQSGMLGIYAGLNADSITRAEEMINAITQSLAENGVTEYEVKRACGQIRSNLIMSRDSVTTRMNENGKSQLLLGYVRTDEQILKSIDNVSEKEVSRCAQEIFNSGKKTVFILKNK